MILSESNWSVSIHVVLNLFSLILGGGGGGRGGVGTKFQC